MVNEVLGTFEASGSAHRVTWQREAPLCFWGHFKLHAFLHPTNPPTARDRYRQHLALYNSRSDLARIMATGTSQPSFAAPNECFDANHHHPRKRRRRELVPEEPRNLDAPQVLPEEIVTPLLDRSSALILQSVGFTGFTASAQERLRELAEDCTALTSQPETYLRTRLLIMGIFCRLLANATYDWRVYPRAEAHKADSTRFRSNAPREEYWPSWPRRRDTPSPLEDARDLATTTGSSASTRPRAYRTPRTRTRRLDGSTMPHLRSFTCVSESAYISSYTCVR